MSLWFVFLCTGCGGTGSVEGKVTINGKPVTLGSVAMFGPDGLPHTGKLQPDGSYSVRDVPVGTARVTVQSPNPASVASRGEKPKPDAENKTGPGNIKDTQPQGPTPPTEKDTPSKSEWIPIPQKYADATQSGLTFTVKKGRNIHNIDLTGEAQRPSSGRQ